MTSPLYSVGQHVAAMNSAPIGSPLSFIVPFATVTDYKWREYGLMRTHTGDVSEMPAGWYYTLDAYPVSPISGNPFWVNERILRPIQPGEYLSDSAPQKLETPTQEEAGTTGSELGRERAQLAKSLRKTLNAKP